jgi:hypothetical protein
MIAEAIIIADGLFPREWATLVIMSWLILEHVPRYLAVSGGALCLAGVAVSRSRSRVTQKASASQVKRRPSSATRTVSSPSATSTSAGAPPSASSGGPRSPPGSTPPNEPSPTPIPLSGTRQSGKPPRSWEFTGEPPGLRTVQRGPLMLVYLTDVRGERVVIVQVNWIS